MKRRRTTSIISLGEDKSNGLGILSTLTLGAKGEVRVDGPAGRLCEV